MLAKTRKTKDNMFLGIQFVYKSKSRLICNHKGKRFPLLVYTIKFLEKNHRCDLSKNSLSMLNFSSYQPFVECFPVIVLVNQHASFLHADWSTKVHITVKVSNYYIFNLHRIIEFSGCSSSKTIFVLNSF